jgi:hypothetical protein
MSDIPTEEETPIEEEADSDDSIIDENIDEVVDEDEIDNEDREEVVTVEESE